MKKQPLQGKALQAINFKSNDHAVRGFNKNDQIIKISDYIKMVNCLFARDQQTNSAIPPFQNYFNKSENLFQHNTRHAKQNFVIVTQQSSDFYGNKANTTTVSVSMEQTSTKQITIFFKNFI